MRYNGNTDKWIKENRITAGIVIVLVPIFAIMYLNKQPIQTNSSAIADIDLQTKCASQAKIFFDYFISDPQERQSDEYSNHYNTKLNKCFILIKHGITSTNDMYTKNFFDAIEKRQYGSYGIEFLKERDTPFDCALYPDGNQDKITSCKSEVEFDAFVKTYMEK